MIHLGNRSGRVSAWSAWLRLFFNATLVVMGILVASLVCPDVAMADGGIPYAVLQDDGEMVLFMSDGNYDVGEEQDATDVMGNSYHGKVYPVDNPYDPSGTFWYPDRQKVLSVRVARGQTVPVMAMQNKFQGCSNMVSCDLRGLDTSQVTSFEGVFSQCSNLRRVNIGSLDTSKATSLDRMFYACSNLVTVDVSGLNTSKVASANDMFSSCRKLIAIQGIGNWATGSLRSAVAMFGNTSALKALDLSNWNTGSLEEASAMFAETGLVSLNLSNWDIRKWDCDDLAVFLGSMSSHSKMQHLSMKNWQLGSAITSLDRLLPNYSYLRTVDMSNWNTGGITSMSILFPNTSSLRSVNMTGWDTSKVTNMGAMFLGLSSITDIHGLDGFNTSKVTNMKNMFYGCASLAELDLSGWDTSKVTDMEDMFSGCSLLRSLGVAQWDVSSVQDFDGMFFHCQALRSIDLSGWSTKSDASMEQIMAQCASLERMTLGGGVKSFVGDADGLPYPDWYNVVTGETVRGMWETFRGETHAGTYIRADLVVAEDLDLGSYESVTYDAGTHEITAYRVSSPYASPSSVWFPKVGETVSISRKLVETSDGLTALLDDGMTPDGIRDGLAFGLVLKSRTYADIMSCVSGERVLWTFDVPKGNESVIRLDIWEDGDQDKPPYDSYVGYVMNSAEHPDKFVLHDADGEVVETLSAGGRHSTRDLLGNEYASSQPIYPKYEDYDSYDSEMDNYEVPMAPGRYRIDAMRVIPSVSLTPSGVETAQNQQTGDIAVSEYVFSASDASVPARMTLFNEIERNAYVTYSGGLELRQDFKKRDALSPLVGVNGAVYKLTSERDGKEYYAVTERGGTWGLNDGALGAIKPQLVGGRPSGEAYTPELYESFLVEEELPPDGYYRNDENCFFTPYVESINSFAAERGTLVYLDGISIRGDDSPDSDIARHSQYDGSFCFTCMAGYGKCECRHFRDSCDCQCCGVPEGSFVSSADSVGLTDMPLPSVTVRKVDDRGNSLSGARLRLLNKQTGAIVDEWVSDGSPHTYRFSEDGENAIPYGAGPSSFVIREVSAPSDTYRLAEDVEVNIAYDSGATSVTMTDMEVTKVGASKVWHSASGTPVTPPDGSEVDFTLLMEGEPTEYVITLDGTPDQNGEDVPWHASFPSMPKYSSSGSQVSYAVTETRSTIEGTVEIGQVASGGEIVNVIPDKPSGDEPTTPGEPTTPEEPTTPDEPLTPTSEPTPQDVPEDESPDDRPAPSPSEEKPVTSDDAPSPVRISDSASDSVNVSDAPKEATTQAPVGLPQLGDDILVACLSVIMLAIGGMVAWSRLCHHES